MEETHGALMTVATLIATMTFQAAISPPGGVWQENVTDLSKYSYCSEKNVCSVGTAVSGYSLPPSYKLSMTCNSVAFIASVLVIFLIISGFPLRNKFCTWVLAIGMRTTLLFLGITHLVSMYMVTPDDILSQLDWIRALIPYIWLGTIAMVSVIHVYRLLTWSSKSSKRSRRRPKWFINHLLKKFEAYQRRISAEQNPLAHV